MEKIILSEPRPYRAAIRARRRLTENTFELELSRPNGFVFLPGQRIHLQSGEFGRDYSLVSSPTDDYLRLCIRHVPQGVLTPILLEMAIGESLSFFGPSGYFLFHASDKPPVFVATGTGIAPFVSMGLAGCSGFILLHGVRSTDELYYGEVLQGAAEIYVPCISGSGRAPDGGFTGRVTEYVSAELQVGEYEFYLCGRREMIRDVTRIVDWRFPGSKVFVELFF